MACGCGMRWRIRMVLIALLAQVASAQTITEFSIPSREPYGITLAADGNLWFTEHAGNRIGRITSQGVITEFLLPTNASQPAAIAAGTDASVWFIREVPGDIARMNLQGVI